MEHSNIKKFNNKQFQDFFNRFDELNQYLTPIKSDDPIEQLNHFIKQWKFLDVEPHQPKKEIVHDFNLVKTQQFFEQFEKHHQSYQRNGFDCNVWEVCGISFEEVKHCQVLKWLFDANGSHRLNDHILRLFVERLLLNTNITIADFADGYKVETEVFFACDDKESETDTDKNSRIDIIIENRTVALIIEVKVNAAETNDQMMRYFRIAKKQYQHKKWEIVYLTKDGRKPSNQGDSDSCENFTEMQDKVISICWSDIAHILYLVSNRTDVSQFIRGLLHQYSQYIYRHF